MHSLWSAIAASVHLRRMAGIGVAILAAATLCVATPAGTAQPLGSDQLADGTAGLRPALARAYTRAWQQAQRQGVSIWITSGKRSYSEQRQMWRDGVARYGSAAAARRWVLPPNESTHVTGEAIDVGPREGATWLEANGRRWGLCRTFDNEWWHFELATTAGGRCPARLPDASTR